MFDIMKYLSKPSVSPRKMCMSSFSFYWLDWHPDPWVHYICEESVLKTWVSLVGSIILFRRKLCGRDIYLKRHETNFPIKIGKNLGEIKIEMWIFKGNYFFYLFIAFKSIIMRIDLMIWIAIFIFLSDLCYFPFGVLLIWKGPSRNL